IKAFLTEFYAYSDIFQFNIISYNIGLTAESDSTHQSISFNLNFQHFRDPIPIRDFLEPAEEIIVEKDSDIFQAIVNRYSIIDGDDDGDDNDGHDEFEEIRPSISEASKAMGTLQSFIFLGNNGGKISVFKAFNQIGNEISQERRDRFTQSSIDNWLVRS
ncbi:hypothetical protein K3495_g16805, partial [Podosphaera aphanis]